MEFLRRYLGQIKAQLNGLTLSQRLLIGLLIVVMIATIFFTVSMSAKPEMVVLIPQSMTSDEINRAEMAMKGKGYAYQVQGDRILVQADKAYQIRGELFAAQALPKDTSRAFDELMKDNDFLRPDASNERRWNYAKQQTLSRILEQFPYIGDAQVILSQGSRAGLGRDAVPASAMVTLKLRGQEALTSPQVVAIADMITGAMAGMRREDVHITDGMRPYLVPSSDTMMPGNVLEWMVGMEEHFTKKLYFELSQYGNVKIAVNVVPDMSQKRVVTSLAEPKVVTGMTKSVTVNDKSSDGAGGGSSGGVGGTPGVSSNGAVGVEVSSGGGATKENKTVENVVKFNTTDTVATVGPGEVKELTASICLPRSYFVSLYRKAVKDEKVEPGDDDEKFKILRDDCLKRVQATAVKAIGVKKDEDVQVSWFDDTIATQTGDAPGTMVSTSSFGSITQYAKQGVLGLVALGALMAMLMMVRRAVPATAGADADPGVFFGAGGKGKGKGKSKGKNEPGQLDAGEDVFGEAGSGEAVLTGIELDDETLQSRKMVDEVSTMIKENPENAATLVKKWLSKGK